MTDNISLDDAKNVTFTLGTIDINGIQHLKLILADENGRIGHLDAISGILPVLDTTHQEMHEGNHYFVKTYIANSGAAASSNYLSFTTPDNNIRMHAKGMMSPDADFIAEIFEDAEVTGGTSKISQNCDRNSSNTASLVVKLDPTIIEEGDSFWEGRSGGGQIKLGVNINMNYEFILKQNTTYLIKFTKVVATLGIADVDIFWYEHTDTYSL